MTTQSEQGEPPQLPAGTTPREGVVLPSGGRPAAPGGADPGRTQPATGQPWGSPWGPQPQAGPPSSPSSPPGPAPFPGQAPPPGQLPGTAVPGQGGFPAPGAHQAGGAQSAPLPPAAGPAVPGTGPGRPFGGAVPPYGDGRPPAPPDDAEATQFIPPVDGAPPTGAGASFPGTGASGAGGPYPQSGQQLPGAGAYPQGGHGGQGGQGGDVESTTRLRIPLPPEGARRRSATAAQPAHAAADETQVLPPAVGAGPGPAPTAAPFGVRPGAPGDRATPAEFDNLFRDGTVGGQAADATQQLPQFDQSGAVRNPYESAYGGGGPAAGGGADLAPGGRSGRVTGLSRTAVIGIVVAGCAVAGLVAGAALSGGDDDKAAKGAPASSPAVASSEEAEKEPSSAADPAAEQAKALSKLLGDSNNSRSTVIASVENIKSCKKLDKAAADLRSAAEQRNQLVTRLSGLTLDKLPRHEDLTRALTEAWQASAKADNHYAAWADQVAGKKGCAKGRARTTKALSRANAASGDATEAKRRAARLWNSTARTYGLPERAVTEL